MVASCIFFCVGCIGGGENAKMPIKEPGVIDGAAGSATHSVTKLGQVFHQLTGTTSFKTEKGMRLIVLTVTNSTDKAMWIPSSNGERYGCEAVNFMVGGAPGTHYDYGLCKFPNQYIKLKPKETHVYVHQLPKDAKGEIAMSIWAPWRTEDGKLIDDKTKGKTLKADEVLIEEVVGAGRVD